MKNHPMMWRVLSLVVALFAALSLTFAPVLAPDFNLAPVFAGDDDDDDDGGRLDFGFIVSILSSDTGTGGMAQPFIATTIHAGRGRVFRGANFFGPSPVPQSPGEAEATFEWVVSRRRKGSARSDTLIQVSNVGTDTFTFTRQYIDQDGDDCTQGTPETTLDPGESVMFHVSEELLPVCP